MHLFSRSLQRPSDLRGAMRSDFGRALQAIRADQTAAEALGINVPRHKMAAFSISAVLASGIRLAPSAYRGQRRSPSKRPARYCASVGLTPVNPRARQALRACFFEPTPPIQSRSGWPLNALAVERADSLVICLHWRGNE